MGRRRRPRPPATKLILWWLCILLLGILVGLLVQASCGRGGQETPRSAPASLGGRKVASKPGRITVKNTKAPQAASSTTAGKPRGRPLKEAMPRVALVIDDLGRAEPSLVRRLCAIGVPMTVAILPFLPHSQESARLAKAGGMEIFLHMPMEPLGYPGQGKNPGPGAVLSGHSEAEVRDLVASAMRDIPFSVGLNNHMGSRITPDRVRIRWILEEVKKSRWLFLDSRTGKDTVALEVAKELGVPSLERKIFLDDSHDPANMAHQWKRALTLSRHDDSVVVIGHILEDTVAFLETSLPAACAEVTFVKVSEMVR